MPHSQLSSAASATDRQRVVEHIEYGIVDLLEPYDHLLAFADTSSEPGGHWNSKGFK